MRLRCDVREFHKKVIFLVDLLGINGADNLEGVSRFGE